MQYNLEELIILIDYNINLLFKNKMLIIGKFIFYLINKSFIVSKFSTSDFSFDNS